MSRSYLPVYRTVVSHAALNPRTSSNVPKFIQPLQFSNQTLLPYTFATFSSTALQVSSPMHPYSHTVDLIHSGCGCISCCSWLLPLPRRLCFALVCLFVGRITQKVIDSHEIFWRGYWKQVTRFWE